MIMNEEQLSKIKDQYAEMKKICKQENITIDYFMYEFELEEFDHA